MSAPLSSRVVRGALILAFLTLLSDQMNKWYMLNSFRIAERSPVKVTEFLDLVMVWNYGISFGMFAKNSTGNSLMLIGIAVSIMGILIHWLVKTPSRMAAAGIGLVLGGAAGNVIDRIVYGAVADFYSFHLGPYYWPAFNIADAGVCVGVALLCIESMLKPEKDGTPKT